MQHKAIFSADISGNETQFKVLVDYAIKISADSIIIGGDIAPGDKEEKYIKNQRQFLEYKLPELLQSLKEKLPNSKLFLMMGNDDCAVNSDILENNELYQTIHGKRVKLTDEFDIVGYSYVPITPFGIKDWEKFDLSEVPSNLKDEYIKRKKNNYRFDGLKSTEKGWKTFQFNPEMEKSDSIQKDLENKLFTENPNKTIYVIHTPPSKTNLDLTCDGHVGSFAVRLFIEKFQPYLTLHGHIHETVDRSGNFKDYIGKTLCMCAGNEDYSKELAVVVFDLYNPKDAKRIILNKLSSRLLNKIRFNKL